jgi:2-iminobutanoate/2-iminopropanoate deaminase
MDRAVPLGFVRGVSKIYSEAAVVGDLVLVAGQAPIDLDTRQMMRGSIGDETRRTLENMKEVLRRAGSSMRSVAKVVVYLSSVDDYDSMNAIYLEYFGEAPPARCCIETRLPHGFKVEMDAIAVREVVQR